MSSAQLLQGNKHNISMHSWWFLKISTESPSLLHLEPFNSLLIAPPEKIKLDLFYANVKYAYSSPACLPFRKSDHTLVLLTSYYTPIVQRQHVTVQALKKWSQRAEQQLRVCFESTDWNALCEAHGDDINAKTECVTNYINFCVDSIIPSRTVRCFSPKPWITIDLKKLLNMTKESLQGGRQEVIENCLNS